MREQDARKKIEAPIGFRRESWAATGAGPLVSVLIVNFNGGALLCESVRAVLASSIPVEVLISDNGSTDGSLQLLHHLLGRDPRVRVIENAANLGFARANNLCLPYAVGQHVLFLNSDCIIEPDTLRHMYQTMEAYPDVGMAGCLIRNPDGTEQAGCRRAVPTPWRASMRVLHLNRLFPNDPHFHSFVLTHEMLPVHPVSIDAISGAFMFVRRSALEQVGPLDEGYFLHCEDLDWCMRFRETGWKIMFVPEVSVVHFKGQSSKTQPIRVLWYKHKGMIRFYRKFFRRQYSWVMMFLVTMAVWTRFLILTLVEIFDRWRGKKPAPPVLTPSLTQPIQGARNNDRPFDA